MNRVHWLGGGRGNTAKKVLQGHLKENGIEVMSSQTLDYMAHYNIEAPIICWGHSTRTNPNLNGKVNALNKYEAMIAFNKAGVPIPTVFDAHPFHIRTQMKTNPFPWLARNIWHKEGDDIVPVRTYEEAMAQVGKKDFFSVFVPTRTEYRVWVFGNKALAVYDKEFKGDGEYEGFQRNHDFGFKFVNKDDLLGSTTLTKPAVKAVAAIGLDFGAVDLLMGKNGSIYVLEVNSMPHIDSSKRVSGIRLAKAMTDWVKAQ
jgi:glutathione synthase/RimK-type ligase-like ATP-grasp enzyme